jgi:hypothetical protein
MPDLSKWEKVAIRVGQNFGVGPVGPQGDKGDTGLQGAQGPTGATGATGLGLVFKGTVTSEAGLPATGNTGGDYYINEATQDCYVWSASPAPAKWVNAGPLTGATGATGPTGPQGPQGQPAQTVTASDIETALGYKPADPSKLTFEALSDVVFTGLSARDVPIYNKALSKWVNLPESTITDGGNF